MTRKIKGVPIEEIQKRFHDEWLLIRVIDFDRKRTLPLTGKLIVHRKKREDLYPFERKHIKTLTLVTHTGERPNYAILL